MRKNSKNHKIIGILLIVIRQTYGQFLAIREIFFLVSKILIQIKLGFFLFQIFLKLLFRHFYWTKRVKSVLKWTLFNEHQLKWNLRNILWIKCKQQVYYWTATCKHNTFWFMNFFFSVHRYHSQSCTFVKYFIKAIFCQRILILYIIIIKSNVYV